MITNTGRGSRPTQKWRERATNLDILDIFWGQLHFENEILIFQLKPDLFKPLVLPLGLVDQTLGALHEELGKADQQIIAASARHINIVTCSAIVANVTLLLSHPLKRPTHLYITLWQGFLTK